MRIWITPLLLVGLAVLPTSVRAQYPAVPYHQLPQMQPTPYYQQPMPPAYGYYPPLPTPRPAPMPMPMPMNMPITMSDPSAFVPGSVYAQPYVAPTATAAPKSPLPKTPMLPAPVKEITFTQALSLPAPTAAPLKPIELPVLETKPAPVRPIEMPVLEAKPAPMRPIEMPVLETKPAPVKPIGEKAIVEEIPPMKLELPSLPSTAPAKKDVAPAVKGIATDSQPAAEKSSTEKIAAPTYVPGATPIGEFCNHCGRSNRLVVFADYLFWNVHGVDVPFAQAFDGVLPGLSVPRGDVAVVSPRFNSGFRVGGGMTFNDGNAGLFGTFTYFETRSTASTTAPDPFVLHNFLAFPGTVNSAADSLTADASYRIRLAMVDIDYKCAIINNDHVMLNWLAGVRYAKLEQSLNSTFQITGSTTVDSNIDFDGVGPRVGLDGKYHVCGGLFGYAQGITDILFGQYKANAEQRNVFTGLIGQTGITANRVVPILELEVGAGWQSHNGAIRVSGGYYVGAWFNTVTMTSLANSISGTNFTTNSDNFRDNMTFDGFVLRFELRY
jgi:hypothetical protein